MPTLYEPCHEKTNRINKGADQLRSNCEAEQRFCFRYTDSTVPLLFQPLAIFCDCTGWFVSDLVGNPEARVSRVAAHILRVLKGVLPIGHEPVSSG